MKDYEIMTIYKVDLGDAGAKGLSAKVKEVITSLEGKVEKEQFWGKRKFAYEINHYQEGYYDVVNFQMDPSMLGKFKNKLNVLNGLLRYLVTAQG